MSPKQPNSLFDHNPPVDDELISKLFYNRDAELALGLDCLSAPAATGKVCAIYGMARSGKSHFAHWLLLRAAAAKLPYICIKVNANTRGTCRAVLEEIFFKIMHLIRSIALDQVPDGQTGVLDEYLSHLNQYEDIVGRESVEFTIERSTSVARTFDDGVKIAARPFDISLATKQEVREGSNNKLVQRGLTERELTEILRYSLDVLSWLHPDKRILIFVDDLDLLDRKGREGHPESDVLVDHLRLLSDLPTLNDRPPTVVLATIRNTSFTDRDKDFRDFVEIRLLEPEHHLEIYRRHIELFNAGQEIFTQDSVNWLEQRSGGQIGIFLRRCRELWGHFYKRLPEGTLIAIEHIKSYVKKDVRDMMLAPETLSRMAEVLSAVRASQTEVALTEDPGHLLFRVLTPLGEAGRKYRINAMYHEVMREMISKGEL